jgi:flavodoxin
MTVPSLMNRRAVLTGSLTLGAGALIAGCRSSPPAAPSATQPREAPPASTAATGSTVLLAYFSRAGENYHYGGRIDLDVGNTAVVSDLISAALSVDVYRIQAADPYPADYDATVERNKREQDQDARPIIAGALPTLTGYDTVLLGSPIWNLRPPMIMRSFIEAVDLRAKTILPFVTYAVSGIGRTVSDYTRLCPDSTIGQGLAIRGEEAHDARGAVGDWLKRTQLLQG